MGSQQRSGGIDATDSPAALDEVPAVAAAKLGTVRGVEILQHPVQQVLERYDSIPSA
jgi:hypothetical protein